MSLRFLALSLLAAALLATVSSSVCFAQASAPANLYPVQEGFVDSQGALIYYQVMGRGSPLVIVHGGPGASHDYFLPYLLPLMRSNKLVFIDERGSGKSSKPENPKPYTIANMVEDIEAVRQTLDLGKIELKTFALADLGDAMDAAARMRGLDLTAVTMASPERRTKTAAP